MKSNSQVFTQNGYHYLGAGRLDEHTSAIEVPTRLLLVGMTYEFVVQVVSSDNRTGVASLMAEIVAESYIPIISIRYVINMNYRNFCAGVFPGSVNVSS